MIKKGSPQCYRSILLALCFILFYFTIYELSFPFCEVIYKTASPLRDLILEQRLAVFQCEAGQLQEVHAPSLCSNAEQVT